jgi:hypothetical protein
LHYVNDNWEHGKILPKASSNMRAHPIERFKIMEKEIDIFGNLLMRMN